MLISHISDIHLGYAQFNLQEREEDVYDVFEESIDKSIHEHVEAIILAGDIFHNPKPNGAAMIKLARELKKLKEKLIPVVFVLGEHDISRTNDVPLLFLYHNLGLAKRLTPEKPVKIKDVSIYGFNKERRSNIDNGLIKPFRRLEKIVKSDESKNKILVLHQGLSDFNKFAGEIFASDLPIGFDYYAMGHYHDNIQKIFPELDNNLVAYPGSLDVGHSESISDVEKGFLIADTSNSADNVTTQWIKMEKRRPQLSYSLEFDELDKYVEYLLNQSGKYSKKPVLELKIKGHEVDSKILTSELSRLKDQFLYYTWNIFEDDSVSGYSYDNERDLDIDKEMSKLILHSLKSEKLTNLSLDLINMINEGFSVGSINKDKSKNIVDYIWKYYNNNKIEYQNKDADNLIDKKINIK
ncbi:MAG TPA: DNA repair exonuclease [Candidatus Nitrosocosmicus sp.]